LEEKCHFCDIPSPPPPPTPFSGLFSRQTGADQLLHCLFCHMFQKGTLGNNRQKYFYKSRASNKNRQHNK